jgi:hypothetical protein
MEVKMRVRLLISLVFVLFIFSLVQVDCMAEILKVKDALQKIAVIAYPDKGRIVDQTVAEALQQELAPQASIASSRNGAIAEKQRVLRVAIIDEKFANGPEKYNFHLPKDKEWMFFRLTSDGEGELVASKPNLLYALFCRIKDNWLDEDIDSFKRGRLETTTFRWLEGSDGIFIFLRSLSVRHYDAKKSLEELARLGCSHVSVNGLASPFSYEQGPPGEIYYRFYNGSPDLDQFVETELNKGIYPPEYLQANLNLLKENTALALEYGLTPGLIICAPRSVPESLFERYPFLRGARVDHSFRSFRPRYTLSLAHPAVRWHYAELIRKIMKEVPELGYVYIWTNDSGSGFEYTATTYPGRNGGPYLIREWKSNEEIAKVAGQNVLRYYRLIRDAASEINPEFRVLTALEFFPAEGETILQGLGNRLDLIVPLSERSDSKMWGKKKALIKRDSYLYTRQSLVSNFVLGVPSPWLAYEGLNKIIAADLDRVIVTMFPPSLVPYSINRRILQAFQMDKSVIVDEVIINEAKRLVGPKETPNLVKVWRLIDEAVRSFPVIPLYQESWAFAPYRLWVRPMVPNIEKISKSDREYYEKYMLSIFNNPTFVDLTADALWSLMSTEEAEKVVDQFDRKVWKPLDKGIALLEEVLDRLSQDSPANEVFLDQRDRLVGLRCHFRTLRNTAAWIAGVHGYQEAKDLKKKKARRKETHDMVLDEIQNTKDLLKLWESSTVDFFPISSMGETMLIYGENFGELLKRKIELMKGHEDDEPYINPNFMWQMPPDFSVKVEEYLKY